MRTRDAMRLGVTLVGSAVLSLYVFASSQAGGFTPSGLGVTSLVMVGIIYGLCLPIMWAIGLVIIPSDKRGNRQPNLHQSHQWESYTRSNPLTQRSHGASVPDVRPGRENGPNKLSKKLATSPHTSPEHALSSSLDLLTSLSKENQSNLASKHPLKNAARTNKCETCGLEFSSQSALASHDEATGHIKNRGKKIVIEGRLVHEAGYTVLSGF